MGDVFLAHLGCFVLTEHCLTVTAYPSIVSDHVHELYCDMCAHISMCTLQSPNLNLIEMLIISASAVMLYTFH